MNQSRWTSLMIRLDCSTNLDTHSKLLLAYREKHRAYHTLDHIEACMRWLDEVRDAAECADELELALWFHDAIYKPFSSSNEQDSARWAGDFLRRNGASGKRIDAVSRLIMATVHDAAPEPGDASLMVDIDLSILGAKPDVYDEFEVAVRKEYKRVPGFLFRKKRRALLQTFLDRDRIFHHAHFHDRLEDPARSNLGRAIEILT